MIKIAYSAKSSPTAEKFTEYINNLELVRSSTVPVDVNWGRANANAKLNPDISNVTNKRRMRKLFAANDVPMPQLIEKEYVLHALLDNRKLIGRPDTHTKGRGLWRINNASDFYKALRGTRKKKAATHFMEYVEAPREYRVHIFKGKSIRISEKLFGTTGATACGLYTTGKPRHNIVHVRAAAKKAVEAVGLDFGAVDILATDDECWVLEVNSAPGLGGSMPAVYARKFQEYINGYS